MFSLGLARSAWQGSPAGPGTRHHPPAEQEQAQKAQRNGDERGRRALASDHPEQHADRDGAQPCADAPGDDRGGPSPCPRDEQPNPKPDQERPCGAGQATGRLAMVVGGPADRDKDDHAAHIDDHGSQRIHACLRFVARCGREHAVRVAGHSTRSGDAQGADRANHARQLVMGAFYALPVETLTFLLTDIEGSTVMLRRLGEEAYAQVLADHHRLIRDGLAAHEGEEVGTHGDAFFAVFSSPRACVAAVTQIQQAIETHPWPGGAQVRVRMGIHTGEAAQTATGLVGLDVHRAARVAAIAHGGQVLLSETAAALVRGSLPAGTALRELGVHRLKDLGRPEQIFQLDAAGLQAEFAPLRSLGNPAMPNNLPAQLATFVGRERELSQLRALVGSSRLVTLTGAGGAGKTRLSLQTAAELLDGSGDGVWLVELAAISDEDAVAPAICEALGIAAQPGRPALETLLDALGPQDVLILLDNCEHLIDACAKIADAILRRCPRVHLLATSREPLSIDGETSYRVPPLSLPRPGDGGPAAPGSSDAVTLFVERARERGVDLPVDDETAPLVASICEQLDGMPLAIELAAARLRSMSLADLNDRLDRRFRLLTGGSRAALGRQQTLQATVGWSYSLLNGAEQTLLRRTSVFAEGFGLGAAENVCGFGDIDVLEVADLLDSLVNKSLVGAEPAGSTLRYRLLETIRQFAAERLAETGDEAAAVAAAPYLEGPDQGMWFARLDTDHANLRRAAEHAAGDPDATTQTLRFAAAMH